VRSPVATPSTACFSALGWEVIPRRARLPPN